MNHALLLTLLIAAEAAIYAKISTLGTNLLTPADYLTSVLGGFRLSLAPATCQLQIENFQTSAYVISGYFPRQPQTSCSSLSISSNCLVSNTNSTLLSLSPNQLNVRFDEVFLTIDEMAIVRMSGVFFNRFQTAENWISIFRSPQQFVYSISNLSVSSYNSLSFIQNAGNWGFSATRGELRIFRVDNVSKITRYNYTGFLMTANNLYDYNSNSIPYADFRAFMYQPRCGVGSTSSVSFQGPFTFVINPYWPELRVLDQRGYEIVALRYPEPKCVQRKGQDYELNSEGCISWFCPPTMFEFNGTCVTSCPLPYYHQVTSNRINRCVLVCQPDQQLNATSRVCSCQDLEGYTCDPRYRAVPFGCLCGNGTYYSVANRNAAAGVCLTSCGPYHYPHQDGICVPCPKNCLKCNLSSNSYSYLKCVACDQTYVLNEDSLCIKNCSFFLGRSLINGSCLPCPTPNCKNCSSSFNACSACFYPYSLYNSSCVTFCPAGFKSQFKEDSTFECRMIPKCPPQFIESNEVNNQSKCFCSTEKKTSYVKACYTVAPPCQLNEYYDANTKECLACPVSCLTCVLDSLNRIECTSCRPDYTLFVTLSKNHYCERNSILSYCPSNYTPSTQTCTANNFEATASVLTNRNACFKNVRNCIICVWGSDSLCSFCRWGTYLFSGQCYPQCPNSTTPYRIQGVCIIQTLDNCRVEATVRSYWLFAKNAGNQDSHGFYYLITANYQSQDLLNDPLGSYFTYSTQLAGKSREVNIAYSSQRCLVCEQGYGLTSSGTCQPCQPPCLTCIYATTSIGSCLQCDQYHRLTSDNLCEKLNPIERPCKAGEYRNQSLVCQSECLTYYRPNYQKASNGRNYTVNCTFNCPRNYLISLSNSNSTGGVTQLTCLAADPSAYPTQIIKLFGVKYILSGVAFYSFVSTHKLIFAQADPTNIYSQGQGQGQRQLSPSPLPSTYTHEFGLIYADRNKTYANSPLLVELEVANIQAMSKQGSIYFGNSIYGYSNATVNPIDIIYSQTYNLFAYGRAFTILLLVFTVLFLGQLLNYKTDNLFITYSVIYLTLPSLNLYPDASSFNSYSFLYGFSWSSYLQLFSNPRDLSQQVTWFDGLLNLPHNNAHLILFVDSNLLRNCWSVFLFLFVVTAALITLIAVFKCLSVSRSAFHSSNGELKFYERVKYGWQKVGYHSKDFDHSYPVLQLLTFFIQNSFLGLVYYSVVNFGSRQWELASKQQTTPYTALAIVLVVAIAIYSALRAYCNRIGGIYCLKRIVLGLWLGVLNLLGGIDQNLVLTILLLIKTELLFLLLRLKFELVPTFTATLKHKFEQPGKKHMKFKTRHTIGDKPFEEFKEEKKVNHRHAVQNENQNTQSQKLIYIIVEQVLIIVVYIFLASVNILKQGSILVVWVILNVFTLSLAMDIFDMLLEFWNRHYSNRGTDKAPFYKKIKSIWEFDHSIKTLAETSDF